MSQIRKLRRAVERHHLANGRGVRAVRHGLSEKVPGQGRRSKRNAVINCEVFKNRATSREHEIASMALIQRLRKERAERKAAKAGKEKS